MAEGSAVVVATARVADVEDDVAAALYTLTANISAEESPDVVAVGAGLEV